MPDKDKRESKKKTAPVSTPPFFNRELSWLEFNDRVLDEAHDKSNPLLERLKFLAITSSNLDEFFMVRVSGILELKEAGLKSADITGASPKRQLAEIAEKVHLMVTKQYNMLNRSILPQLEKENIFFLDYSSLTKRQKDFANNYFENTLYPILTPMAIDQGHPFPFLGNKSLNLIAALDSPSAELFAVVQVPSVVSRCLRLPVDNENGDSEIYQYILIEEVIKENLHKLFLGHTVISGYAFRITRNSYLEFEEEDAQDLLNEIEKSIKKRKYGEPVRLEIDKRMSKNLLQFLEKSLDLGKDRIYEISGPLDLTLFMGFGGDIKNAALKDAPLMPAPCPDFAGRDMFEVIREKDVLMHHPYDSFDSVVKFIQTAAADSQVLAIKQTLYRVSGNSPIVNALIQAAENNKQVTVLVELKARFDEENNINWAKKLEKSGCHVVYGLVGLKTHCKICLVVRRDDDGIRRYIHLGTGNYNDSTAKVYTDLGLFTTKETFGQDISALFNVLTGYSIKLNWNKISVAPVSLRELFLKLIEEETQNAAAGKPAQIRAKMNSLSDPVVISALYKASAVGVKIDLIVRGICCLKPGVDGLSENINVVSIVGRFLEHSRIYMFGTGQSTSVYLSSADWMPRNFDRRVETAFPVEDERLKNRLVEIVDVLLSDTQKLRILQPDGSYIRVDKRGKTIVNAQALFLETAQKNYALSVETPPEERFKPV